MENIIAAITRTGNRFQLILRWTIAILWAIAVHTVFPRSKREDILAIAKGRREKTRFYLDKKIIKVEIEYDGGIGLALIEFDAGEDWEDSDDWGDWVSD